MILSGFRCYDTEYQGKIYRKMALYFLSSEDMESSEEICAGRITDSYTITNDEQTLKKIFRGLYDSSDLWLHELVGTDFDILSHTNNYNGSYKRVLDALLPVS